MVRLSLLLSSSVTGELSNPAGRHKALSAGTICGLRIAALYGVPQASTVHTAMLLSSAALIDFKAAASYATMVVVHADKQPHKIVVAKIVFISKLLRG